MVKSAIFSSLIICTCNILLIFFLFSRNLQSLRFLTISSFFGNSGYIGIPVALSLLPLDSLNVSIGYDIGAKILFWIICPLVVDIRNNYNFFGVIKSIIKNPVFIAIIISLILKLLPWHFRIAQFFWIPSRILIFFSLSIVGIKIAALRKSNNSKRLKVDLFTVLFVSIKLLLFPLFTLILCFLINIENMITHALVLQAASPTAISVLIFSEANNKYTEKILDIVLLSTLLSFLSITLWHFSLLKLLY